MADIRLVSGQQFGDEGAGFFGPLGCGIDHHAIGNITDTRCRQHALAFDFNHAGPAVAIRPITGGRLVAEMRDQGTLGVCRLPDGGSFGNGDILAIKGKGNGFEIE